MSGLRQKLPVLALMLILLPQSHTAQGESPVDSSRFEWRTIKADSDDAESKPRRQPAQSQLASEQDMLDDQVPETRTTESDSSRTDPKMDRRTPPRTGNRSVQTVDFPQSNVRQRANWFEDDGITQLVRRARYNTVSTRIPVLQNRTDVEYSIDSTAPITSSEVFSAVWLDGDVSARRVDFATGQVRYLEDPFMQVPLVPPPPTPAGELVPVPDNDSSRGFVESPITAIPQPLYEEPPRNLNRRFRFMGPDEASHQEPGIGQERVQFAPFEMDVTQPSNYWLIRVDAASGLQSPDRGAYFWSRPTSGAQNSVDYQDLRFINETGTDSFSVMTEIPVRAVQYNTTGGGDGGLGDMKVATKVRFINGKKWQLTQISRMYINTGSLTKGLGAGHLSLEPGILARYQVNPDTYLHGEAKLWFPLGANPLVAGQVLRYGVGVSHVLYETDTFAILPTLEMVAFQYLGGHSTYVNTTTPFSTSTVSNNGDVAVNVINGARFVFGPPGDLGLFELGISGMFGLGTNKYLDGMLRVDLKFNY